LSLEPSLLPDDASTQLEVRIDDETVWLSQKQMAILFDCSVENIRVHLSNIYKEEELKEGATSKDFLEVQQEGARFVKRKVVFYNLDAAISIGYRVNSKRGTQFRIWANGVLKEYLLKGYAINQRVERIERKMWEHDEKFDLLIRTNLPPNEGIFYDGQIFDAYKFVSNIIRLAKLSIVRNVLSNDTVRQRKGSCFRLRLRRNDREGLTTKDTFSKNAVAEYDTQGERSSASRVTRFDVLLRPPIFFFGTRLSVP